MTQLVLIVDDDPIQRRLLDAHVSRLGLDVRQCAGGRAAIDILTGPDSGKVSAVVLDLMMPDRTGGDVMAEMRKLHLDIPVIVQTAKGSIDTVVDAMKAGAFDFVVKPVSPEKLKVALGNALKVSAANQRRVMSDADAPSLAAAAIDASPSLTPVLAAATKAAQSDIPILISGETGSGKEWLARAIKAAGLRRRAPFVAVNCGALPGELVESLLFGHAKGAFTDATAPHAGKFVEADGGTLFLDEIGELPPMAQVKLLRVLQDGAIDPVGGRHSVRTDVRIISATNRDLAEDVRAGRFREDLYYRLNAFELTVPPLRERRQEIAGMTRRFVARLIKLERQTTVRSIGEAAIDLLCRYDWPGNVRQLENVLHRAVVLGEGKVLTIADFPQIAGIGVAVASRSRSDEPTIRTLPLAAAGRSDGDVSNGSPSAQAAGLPAGLVERRKLLDRRRRPDGGQANERGRISPPQFPVIDENGDIRPMEAVEADLIRLAVDRYKGRMSEIARRLGIGRSTLYRKMREYDIEA